MMKLAIFLLALCAVLFVVVRATPNKEPAPNGSSDVTIPAWIDLVADLPFGSGLNLKTSSIPLKPGRSREFHIPPSSSQAQVGWFSLTQGSAAIVSYSCGKGPSTAGCEQTQCLIAAPAVPLPAGCPDAPSAHCDQADFSARKDINHARISVLQVGGKITVCAPSGVAAIVGVD